MQRDMWNEVLGVLKVEVPRVNDIVAELVETK